MDDHTEPEPGHRAPRRRATGWTLAPSWPKYLASGRQRIMAVTAVVCVALGAVLALALSGNDAKRPPTPPRPAAASSAPSVAPSSSHAKARPAPFRCARPSHRGGTAPVRICIPSIRVDAGVMQLGLNHDRTVQVPPLSKVGTAGWYRYSARPGSSGPAVILGHVDSAQYGDGVFFHLSKLRRGDTVAVASGDGHTATYRIDSVHEVSKSHFPSQEVYGSTSGPAIRLVTCGGRFDSATGSYLDNIIAYGTLASTSRSA